MGAAASPRGPSVNRKQRRAAKANPTPVAVTAGEEATKVLQGTLSQMVNTLHGIIPVERYAITILIRDRKDPGGHLTLGDDDAESAIIGLTELQADHGSKTEVFRHAEG
jgi:hypothetical protein